MELHALGQNEEFNLCGIIDNQPTISDERPFELQDGHCLTRAVGLCSWYLFPPRAPPLGHPLQKCTVVRWDMGTLVGRARGGAR